MGLSIQSNREPTIWIVGLFQPDLVASQQEDLHLFSTLSMNWIVG